MQGIAVEMSMRGFNQSFAPAVRSGGGGGGGGGGGYLLDQKSVPAISGDVGGGGGLQMTSA